MEKTGHGRVPQKSKHLVGRQEVHKFKARPVTQQTRAKKRTSFPSSVPSVRTVTAFCLSSEAICPKKHQVNFNFPGQKLTNERGWGHSVLRTIY